MDVPQQTANESWQNQTHTFCTKRIHNWTEHLPKSIKINDTVINFVPILQDPRGYIEFFTFIQSACNEHM